MDERTLTPVQGLPALPGQFPPHRPTGETPVSIARLQLPLVMGLTAAFALASAATSILFTWWKVSAHTDDVTVHVDRKERERGGGLAYKGDIREEAAKIRNALRKLGGNCAPIKGDGWSCTFVVPEPIE